MKIKVGSRNSKLAITQTNWVLDEIKKVYNDIEFELVEIVSKGDKLVDKDLSLVGGKGLFTKELEEMLLDGSIDFAVHSLKDMPTDLEDHLEIVCIPQREDVRDMLVTVDGRKLMDLPQNAIVGTSSLRRTAHILNLRPDLDIRLIRGNVETRLRKLNSGEYDATLLAVAGLKRLNLLDSVKGEIFEPINFTPAAGQGALAIEVNKNNHKIIEILNQINDYRTAKSIEIERTLLARLGGSCNSPIGIYGHFEEDDVFSLTCSILSKDGQTKINETIKVTESDEASDKLYNILVESGALDLLK